MDSVEYLQCNGGKWQKQDPYPRVCEVNFSVTEPYILQKTPSGTISKTTEDLSTYHMYADGTKTFDGYIKDSLVNSSDYSDVKGRAKQAFDNFYNKYQKLAVKVEGTMFGSTTVKKVPGKNIYFVEGDLTIDGYYYLYDKSKTRKEEKRGNNAVYDKPFTIVQVGGNTTIKGNLNHNMMLLTNGTITFDGSLNCNDAQVVR
ncbi:MAG: hypothetical protein LBH96_05870 [Candidatus Peribacteria bacterium]|nr:hypothetical protein [Candidatus Peribacteria bacterium]